MFPVSFDRRQACSTPLRGSRQDDWWNQAVILAGSGIQPSEPDWSV